MLLTLKRILNYTTSIIWFCRFESGLRELSPYVCIQSQYKHKWNTIYDYWMFFYIIWQQFRLTMFQFSFYYPSYVWCCFFSFVNRILVTWSKRVWFIAFFRYDIFSNSIRLVVDQITSHHWLASELMRTYLLLYDNIVNMFECRS